MLTACATSPAEPPAIAPDPVIETRIVTRTVCPAEISAAVPARPQPGDDAIIRGNAAGMDWLNRLIAFAGLMETRLSDAARECEDE